jgi:tetratricopeptide (TPR) repeat protein
MLLLPFQAAAQTASTPNCSVGAYYLAHGDVDRALRALEGARGGSGDLAEANLKGLALLLSGRLEEAKVQFEAILKRDPSFLHARFNHGLTLLRQGDAIGAGTDFKAVWEGDMDSLRPVAAFHLALAEQSRNRLEQAKIWLDKAIAINPDFAEAHLVKGTVLERMQQFEQAGQSYREVLRIQPRSAVAMLRFGVSAWRAGFRDTALTSLRQVESLAPGSREALEAQKYLLIVE